MNALPSDRYVLQCIYEMYKDQYPGSKSEDGRSANDPYISIDVQALADKLECNPELLFGRLYYHLDKKHRYKQEDGTLVPLFHLSVGKKRHAVNFPYLASVLAGENRDYLRFILPLGLSSLALVVSVVSLVVGMLLKR
jgi:hypothetical protein